MARKHPEYFTYSQLNKRKLHVKSMRMVFLNTDLRNHRGNTFQGLTMIFWYTQWHRHQGACIGCPKTLNRNKAGR
jgi:hypothetical protein